LLAARATSPARLLPPCARRPRRLLELKIVAAQTLTHAQFFALFGSCDAGVFADVYATQLRPKLGAFAQTFWDESGAAFFKAGMYAGSSGFAAWLLLKLGRLLGLGGLLDGACFARARPASLAAALAPRALRAQQPWPSRAAPRAPPRAETKTCADIESQRLVYAKYSSRIAAIAAALNYTRRLWCPLIAVPASQLHLFSGNIVKVATDNLFLNTFVRGDNYHFYGYLYGEYTRECCPRYLKAENFAKLRAAVANIDIRTGLLQDVAASYPDGYFSRYILLDHMDWMPMRLVLDEWAVFVRKARADVRFLWRSFSDVQHIAPLKFLDFHADNVKAALAMYPDRVCMYNSTHLATLNPGFTIVPREEYKASSARGRSRRMCARRAASPPTWPAPPPLLRSPRRRCGRTSTSCTTTSCTRSRATATSRGWRRFTRGRRGRTTCTGTGSCTGACP
jgi:S-adenosylmethionine-diacylglycerol 3-amino-3-carboxypropyl transferase